MFRHFILVPAICMIFVSAVFAQWQQNYLPSGTVSETVVVDETINQETIQGVLCACKSGGMLWIPYDDTNGWGEFQQYNNFYIWAPGCDSKVINDTLYAINATFQYYHIYYYDNGEWREKVSRQNKYFQYKDAAFFDVDNDGEDSPYLMLVSNFYDQWRPKSAIPLGRYEPGLYLYDNPTQGYTPSAADQPISGTGGYRYEYIYRDLEEDHIFYALCDDDDKFKKVVVEYDQREYSATVNSDFTNATLTEVLDFYQCFDGDGYIHQYLLAKSSGEWDVWHRDNDNPAGTLEDDGWVIEWDDIASSLQQGLQGFFAHEGDSRQGQLVRY